MTDFFCDFCLHPEPGKECPYHGTDAWERVRVALLRHMDKLADQLEEELRRG